MLDKRDLKRKLLNMCKRLVLLIRYDTMVLDQKRKTKGAVKMNKEKRYNGGRLIKENKYYKLTGSKNTQDTNYYVHRIYRDEMYLIDSSDLYDYMDELGYNDIQDIPYKELIEISWRGYEVSYLIERYSQSQLVK